MPTFDITKLLILFAIMTVTWIGLFFALKAMIRRINNKCSVKVEKRSLYMPKNWPFVVLVLWIIILTTCYGHSLFSDSYRYSYNQGNGAYYAQVLHNVKAGHGPEQTIKYKTLSLETNNTYYASSFALVPHILPLLLLAPIYSLYPYPPMHVFSVIIAVMTIGVFGVYFAIRAIGGNRGLSTLGAIAYCLLPWIEVPIFFHGAFDNLGFAIYPWVFVALFRTKTVWLCVISLSLALISVAYAYAVIAIGLVAILFYKQYRAGVLVILIGIVFSVWEGAIMKIALVGITDTAIYKEGLIQYYLFGKGFWVLLKAGFWHLIYVLSFLMALAFIPIIALRVNKKWNYQLMGLILLAMVGVLMAMLRCYGVQYHRNSLIIVPLYLSAFMGYCSLVAHQDIFSRGIKKILSPAILGPLFFTMMISAILWGNMHAPWSILKKPFLVTKSGQVMQSLRNKGALQEKARECEKILDTINKYVPQEAPIAYRIESGVEAYITNRQKAWYFGEHPEGIEYYIIQTIPIDYIDENLPSWKEPLDELLTDQSKHVLYRDERLVIIANNEPKKILRNEEALGWQILWKSMTKSH